MNGIYIISTETLLMIFDNAIALSRRRGHTHLIHATIYILGLVLALFMFATTVQAHAFTVLLVSSFSGPNATIGQAVRDGFLVASAERDGHSDETSNGHLGGLDVHLRYCDTVSNSIVTKLRDRLKQGDIDMVVVIQKGMLSNEVRAAVKNVNVVLVTPIKLPFTGLPSSAPTAAMFVQIFVQRFSYQPDRFAAQGYQLARRIDAAVRPFESVSNITVLRQRLESSSIREFAW